MEAKLPKISVITINYNNLEGLRKTVSSVLEQNYENLEYIVIDGGSVDGSVEFIEESKGIFHWVSEKDNGIYHAMNKGISFATGRYCLFLNSGDYLISKGILTTVAPELNYDLVYGNLLMFTNQKQWIWTPPATLSFKNFYSNTIPHPATFINRELFATVGMYDETLNIVSDWKFFALAFGRYNCSYKHLNLTISAYNFDGMSSKEESLPKIEAERKAVLMKEFPHFFEDYKQLEMLTVEMKKINYFLKLRKFVKRLSNGK